MDAFQEFIGRALDESALMSQMHDLPHERAIEASLASLFAAAVRRSLDLHN